jgi:hypothetical protein
VESILSQRSLKPVDLNKNMKIALKEKFGEIERRKQSMSIKDETKI